MIIANVYHSETGPLRPLDDANIAMYEQKAVDFVRRYKPAYLGLGIEVNVLRERRPQDFEAFVRLFDETYDLVKAESPQTQVFTVFQLERLEGLQGPGLEHGEHLRLGRRRLHQVVRLIEQADKRRSCGRRSRTR